MSLSALQLDSSGEFDLLYNFFYVKNYTGQESYSSYALPITPLTFIPNLTDGIEDFISNKRLVWDFGDGTTTETITASHAYTTPGRYKVTCYLYDNKGTGYFDTYSAKVDISDYIEDKLLISSVNNTLTGTESSLTGPAIEITRFNSYRSVESGMPTITPYASGSDGVDRDYFSRDLINNTYGHLYPFTSFYQYLTTNSIVESVEVDSVTTVDTNIYVKLDSSNNLVHTTSTDPDGVFAGLSGIGDVYFKSDYLNDYNLIFGFKTGDIFKYTNTTSYALSTSLSANVDYNSLSITSNGIDGEGAAITSFNINSSKFANTKIAFVVKVKDSNFNSIKNLPLLSAVPSSPALNIVLTDGTTDYNASFTSNFQELSTLDRGSFFKGYFTTTNGADLTNVYLSAYTVYNSTTLSGSSNTFTIHPSSYYIVAKHNEDINFKDTFAEVVQQPLFTDAPILMNDFLGSIFGDLSSAQDSIGKSTYEKIQNFLDNNSVIDTANVDQLASLLKTIDLPSIPKYSFPPKLKRLVDLLSISKSKLFGYKNLNNKDYNTYGYRESEVYGQNLGDALTITSKVVPGDIVVGFEKYSGTYVALNTNVPLSASQAPPLFSDPGIFYSSSTGSMLPSAGTANKYYILSAFDSSWGWPILSGGGRSIFDIYNFYYQKELTGDITGSIINFSDGNTTITHNMSSYSDWTQDNGIVSNIFANALYDGLDLF